MRIQETLESIYAVLVEDDSERGLSHSHLAQSLTSIDTVTHQNHRLMLDLRERLDRQLKIMERKPGRPRKK